MTMAPAGKPSSARTIVSAGAEKDRHKQGYGACLATHATPKSATSKTVVRTGRNRTSNPANASKAIAIGMRIST